MLITPEYRELNRRLHEEREDYGAGTQTRQWFGAVQAFAQILNAASILDWGAGKCEMGKALSHLMIIPYDPAIAGIDDHPEPHDLLVSLDVLEHIEPECLDDVLDEMARCAKKGVFLTVNLGPAFKTLADGRNAHLIQKPIEWWLPKLMQRWDIISLNKRGNMEFVFTGQPLSLAQPFRGKA